MDKDLIVQSHWPSLTIPNNISFVEFLFKQWAKAPIDHIALQDIVSGEQVTYEQLHWRIIHVANELATQLNVRRGSRLCIFSFNHIDYPVVALAGALLGAVIFFYNPLYTTLEMNNFVTLTQPEVAFVNRSNLSVVEELSAKRSVWSSLRHVLLLENVSFQSFNSVRSFWEGKEDLYDEVTWSPNKANIQPQEDVCFVLNSSGTTGLPKGVMLTHFNVVANCLQNKAQTLSNHFNYCFGKPAIVTLPMFHAGGLIYGVMHGLSDLKTLHIMNKFDANLFVESVSRIGLESFFCVPSMMISLNKSNLLSKFDISRVNEILVGAAPLDKSAEEETFKLIPSLKYFNQVYGMTECVVLVTRNTPEVNRSGSVGKVLSNVEACIVDPKSSQRVGPGISGEVLIRGPMVMKGYWDCPEATSATIDQDGWLHTGDLGYFDEDGFLFIVDRLKEMIKYNGYQVSPAELEGIILTHPDVADVAVVGVPDSHVGELPRAYVILKYGRKCSPEMIVTFVADRVSPQKHLRGGVHFVEEIPKTGSGKILRRLFRNEILKEQKAKL